MAEIVRQHRIRLAGGPVGATTPFENLVWRDSGLSPALGSSVWESCPMLAIEADPVVGIRYFEDFVAQTIGTNTIGGWTFTNATTGAITISATAAGGVALITAGAVTAGQGVNWQIADPSWAVGTAKMFWYEARCLISGLSTTPKVQFFAGLAAAGSTALITSNAVDTTKDFIGFGGVSTTGVMLSTTAASSVATTDTGFTWATDVWHKLGIFATPTAVKFYVDGTVVSTIATNIPAGQLAPIFVLQANATVTPILNLDYLRVVGIR